MPADYDKIREDNIREYGQGTRHLSFLGRLYTDRTHFIFELLQNAEDANATRILFSLFEDRLEVTHDGRIFTEMDVRGVCGVGEGTKTEDLTQIGKFGIGFKSVYAYTATPEIHSGEQGFRIENYVRPFAAPHKPSDNSWTTLFVFPFNSEGISPGAARKEIGARLRNLSARTLLFLRKIREIEYRLPSSAGGVYLREESLRGPARQVRVIGQNTGKDEEENWLIFERPVPVPGNSNTVRVEVSFRLEAEDKSGKNLERIVKVKDAPLVVYFPTEKATRFGFLIQGPYRTTPSRDNIPKDDEWNETLVKETAKLIAGILSEIKELGLLSVSFLEALPIRIEDFPDDSMFYPIVESVRNTLSKEELLPADDGSFVSARNTKLARGADLRKLLSEIQLGQFFQAPATMKWLAGEITQDRTPDLRSYLISELKVEEVNPDIFARRISRPFLSRQPDKWFIDFYRYLSGQEALWKAPLWKNDSGGILRSKPILKLANGSLEAPFNPSGTTPNAFLPPPEQTAFPIVKRSIAIDEQARTFLTRLGLAEPDIFDDIVNMVLPKYANNRGRSVSDSEHMEDMQKIIRAMASDSESGKDKVLQAAKGTPFLKTTNQFGDISFKNPAKIYFNTPELRLYFLGFQEVWFLCDDYSLYVTSDKFWHGLGISGLPRKIRSPEGPPYAEREYSTRSEEIENFDLEGLEQFLNAIQSIADFKEQRYYASVLWHFLNDYLKLDDRLFRARYNWFYYSWHVKFFNSMILTRLQSSKWIPTKDGSLEKPSEINTDKLREDFLGAVELIKGLEILEGSHQDEEERKRNHATELGVDLEDIEYLKNNRDEFERWKADMAARKERPTFPARPVADLSRRQERLSKQLTEAPDKEYEKQEKSVRATSGAIDPITWLRTQYTNNDGEMVCQICKSEMPFRKRDGKHYFEKREILSSEYLSKEHEAQYLALCPLCAAKYTEFIVSDNPAMIRLRKEILNSQNNEVQIMFGKENASIKFVESHHFDLKTILTKERS